LPLPEQISAMLPEITAWRRDFHANPEIGFQERRTSAIVARKLTEWVWYTRASGKLVSWAS
jgi:metal-dependent amidase/aminoacylase/carboxypeptidase family protein